MAENCYVTCEDAELTQLFTDLRIELREYLTEARTAGTRIVSAYGQDLGRLFVQAKEEIHKRGLNVDG